MRSQEIDALGENVDELTARAAMEGVIGNVARAIRKLASAGIEHFVVTADHGHQFSIRKHDDMKIDNLAGTRSTFTVAVGSGTAARRLRVPCGFPALTSATTPTSTSCSRPGWASLGRGVD